MPIRNVTCLSDLANEDIIDSRDLVTIIEELEDEQDAAIENEHDDSWDDTDGAELLDALRELRDDTEQYSGDNWDDGVTFISDDYFETYAQELADDIGAIDKNAAWPLAHIDWEAAADALKVDYTLCTIDDTVYWYR